MENWMIYALLASISIGLYGYMTKVQTEQEKIHDTAFILYPYLYLTLFSFVGIYVLGREIVYSQEVIFYSALITFVYVFVIKTRLISLKYLSSSTYFINYRIISSLILLAAGMLIFGEDISSREFLGVGIGFIVFYLLLEKKNKKESKKNLKKGFLYLVYGALLVSVIQIAAKDFVLKDLDIASLAFFEGIFGVIAAMFMIKGKDVRKVLKVGSIKNHIFIIIASIFFTASIILNNMAFYQGDIAIVYKIISYSLFIPVILSIIFYKEKVGTKKLIAFILTIISIALFI